MEQMICMLICAGCMLLGAAVYGAGIKAGRAEKESTGTGGTEGKKDDGEEKEEAMPEHLRRQWENYLSYDGTPQEDE